MGIKIICNSSQIDISVIVPCYNSFEFIGQTILAAYDSLAHISSEIIVVNDGSTDDSEKIIDQFSFVKKINIKNSGVSVARNIGALAAKGKYFIFCDADDLLLETAFNQIELNIFNNNPGVIFGDYLNFGPGAKGLPDPKPEELKYPDSTCQILNGVWRPSASYLIRRDVFFKSGMFNPFLSVVADCNFYFKLFFVAEKDITYHPFPIAMYRKNAFGESMATSNKYLFLYDCFFNAVEAKLMWIKNKPLTDYQRFVLFSVFDFIAREAHGISNKLLVCQCSREIGGLNFILPPFKSFIAKLIYLLFGFRLLVRLRSVIG